MDCQSRCLLKALIPLMFQEPLGFGVPCLGQRLHVGIDERNHGNHNSGIHEKCRDSPLAR